MVSRSREDAICWAAVTAGAVSAAVAALSLGELSTMATIFGKTIAVLGLLGALTTAAMALQARQGPDGGRRASGSAQRFAADAAGATGTIAERRAQGQRPAGQADAGPLADLADVPAQDLRAGGDDRKRYFLIGA